MSMNQRLSNDDDNVPTAQRQSQHEQSNDIYLQETYSLQNSYNKSKMIDQVYDHNNNNIDQYSDTDEYVDIHTAREQQLQYSNSNSYNNYSNNTDTNTVYTAANIHSLDYNNMNTTSNNNNMNMSMDIDATTAIHEMHLTLLYMMSNPIEFEKCIPKYSNTTTTTTNNNNNDQQRNHQQQQSLWNDDQSYSTEATDFTMQQQQQMQQHQGRSNTNTTNTNTLTSIVEDGIQSMMNHINIQDHTTNNSNNNNHQQRTTTTSKAESVSHGNNNNDNNDVLLPYLVFCDDAEIVLPQAYTANQLYGIELYTGIELEAASTIIPICQLFLRWIALMPHGDHLYILNPPGLTVMKIIGNRYRVTAAHRVVWTWMNEFATIVPAVPSTSLSSSTQPSSSSSSVQSSSIPISKSTIHTLQMGDLVGMTIIDVFECDQSGKLLSYCPTFDNRNVYKIDRTTYQLQKHTSHIMKNVISKIIFTSKIASNITKYTTSIISNVHQRVTDVVQNYQQQQQQQVQVQQQQSEEQQQQEEDEKKNKTNVLPINKTSSDSTSTTGNTTTLLKSQVQKQQQKQQQQQQQNQESFDRTISKVTSESTSQYHGDDDIEYHEV